MSNLYDSFPAPQLKQMPELLKMPYSQHEWERMHMESHTRVDDSQFVSDPTTKKMYGLAYREADPNNAKDWLQVQRPAPIQSVHDRQQHTATPKAPKAQKVQCALASWCGFSKKAAQAHKAQGLGQSIEELWCDKEHKDHPLCKRTRGFPTYYKDGKVIQTGYTPHPKKLI